MSSIRTDTSRHIKVRNSHTTEALRPFRWHITVDHQGTVKRQINLSSMRVPCQAEVDGRFRDCQRVVGRMPKQNTEIIRVGLF